VRGSESELLRVGAATASNGLILEETVLLTKNFEAQGEARVSKSKAQERSTQ